MQECILPATAEIGTPLIVGDPELDDRYIADLMKTEHYDLTEISPVVLVRFVLRYPIQHAILWKDNIHENAPVEEGRICRLQFFGFAVDAELTRFKTYAESLKAAQEEALRRAIQVNDPETEAILRRHMRGEYGRPRVLISYKRWEI